MPEIMLENEPAHDARDVENDLSVRRFGWSHLDDHPSHQLGPLVVL
jgi:hypothetical protein